MAAIFSTDCVHENEIVLDVSVLDLCLQSGDNTGEDDRNFSMRMGIQQNFTGEKYGLRFMCPCGWCAEKETENRKQNGGRRGNRVPGFDATNSSFRPKEQLTADEVLKLEEMIKWAWPAYDRS